jgi:hypothetical protein
MSQMTPAIAYLRVSTEGQGRSGLGLEAQRAAVAVHVHATGGRIVTEHVEVESGRKKDRPRLAARSGGAALSGGSLKGRGHHPAAAG